jgi:hypothetical protein
VPETPPPHATTLRIDKVTKLYLNTNYPFIKKHKKLPFIKRVTIRLNILCRYLRQ